MFRRAVLLFLYVALVLSLFGSLLAPAAATGAFASPFSDSGDDAYTIKLRSRQFRPAVGFDALEQSRLAAAARATAAQGSSRIHALVQLYEIPSPARRAVLAEQGIELLTYLPNRAWVAAIPGNELDRVAATPGLRWLGELQVDDKLAPEIREERFGSWHYDAQRDVVAVVIELHDDVDLNVAGALVLDNGGLVRGYVHSINGVMAEMPRRSLRALAVDDRVLWVEAALPPLSPTNDGARAALNVDVLQPFPYNPAPTYSLDGSGVDVLVYDGGQVDNHPDFAGRLTIGASDTSPISDHATHVAGTVGGDGAQSAAEGGDPWQWRGMATNVDIISYGYEWDGMDIFLYDNPGDLEDDWDEAKNTYGADMGTASLGTNTALYWPCAITGDYHATSQLIDTIVRGSLGEPYIATWANGNERQVATCGDEYYTTAPPACAKNPIHVGATNSNDDSMTSFSSWGPCDDGRLKPIIAAPGCQTGGDGGIFSTMPGGTYDNKCGTSMATPAVAGIVALMLQQYRDTYNTAGEFLPSTAKALLMNTATDLGNAGPDFQFGYGHVDAQVAVDAVIDGLFREGVINVMGQTDEYAIQVPLGATQLQVSLAWDDPGVAPLTTPALVNDLNLILLDPDGGLHLPWVLDPGSPANAATIGFDTLNNQEQVTVDSPDDGIWRVQVVGATVPAAPQRYSLAATHNMFSLNIDNPTQAAPADVGFHDDPEKLLISLDLRDRHGGPLGTPIDSAVDLEFSIGGDAPASVFPGGNVGNQYWVLVTPPTKGAAGCHDLEVSLFGVLNDTETDAVCYGNMPTGNQDVMLVIDKSGSMGVADKMPATQDAAKFFVTAVDQDDMIGVDSFATIAQLEYPLTTVTGAAEKDAANMAVDALVAGGWTAMGAGIDVANLELMNNGDAAHQHTMVLLSDGKENQIPMWAAVEPTVPADTIIHTVALGPEGDPDEVKLSTIAASFNGHYYRVPTGGAPLFKALDSISLANDLHNILADIYRSAAEETYGWERLWEASGPITSIGDRYEVYVEQDLREAIFAMHFAGFFFPPTLRRPDGSIVNPGDADVLEYREVSTQNGGHVQYRLKEPPAGIWLVNVGQGEVGEYIALLEARSQTELLLLSPQPGQHIGFCQAVPILAAFMGKSQPIVGAQVLARLIGPATRGEPLTIPLYDDGDHGDSKADDGLYGNTFLPCPESQRQEDPIGSYQVKVLGAGVNENGEPVQRSATGAYYANASTTGDLPPPALILLVDDDDSNPDVRSYYTNALDALDANYDVWDVANDGPPSAGNLSAYHTVIWFTGDDFSTTLDNANEAALASFLNSGGKLFLSSQDYFKDLGFVNAFMRNFLHIDAVQQDVGATSVQGVAGNPVGDGLGPYPTSLPPGFLDDFSDRLTPRAGGNAAFVNQSDAPVAVTFTDGNYCTLFAAFPFEFLDAGAAEEMMQRILGWECWDPSILVIPSEVEGSLWANTVVTTTADVFNPGLGKLAWAVNRGPIHLWAITDADGETPTFLDNLDPTLLASPEAIERASEGLQPTEPLAVTDEVRLNVCALTSSVADCCDGPTCSSAELLDEDVLVIYSDQAFVDNANLGNLLADYVDQGGTVIVAMNALVHGAAGLGGRFMNKNYSPLKSASASSAGVASLGVYDPGHPLMSGVSSAFALSHLDVFCTDPGLNCDDDVELIASWNDGEPFVAIKRHDPAPIAGRVIAVNAPLDDGAWGGDLDEIVTNAIQWLSDNIRHPPWLNPVCSFSPPQPEPLDLGDVAAPTAVDYTCPLINAGDDWALTLQFDGSDFASNPAYLANRPLLRGKATIEHNVSDQGRVNIPVTARLGCGLADVNCDDLVDIRDLQELSNRWQTAPGADYYYDLDDSGFVDLADVIIAAGLWNTSYQ